VNLQETLRDLVGRLEGAVFPATLPPRYPEVAVEIAPDRLTVVRVAPDKKSRSPVVRAVETRELPEGAIEASFARPNVLVAEPVMQALESALSGVGPPDHRVSLLIPDHVARVALLSFATLPRTRRELAELVRFRMAKSLPFKPEEAAMDLTLLHGAPTAAVGAGGAPTAGITVLAAFVHRAVLEQYEALLAAAGYWPGLVGLSTIELYNLARPRLAAIRLPDKDTLLLNATPHYLALLIFRGGELLFYRCKAFPGIPGADEVLVAMRREIYTSLAFYQEKLLGRGVGRVLVRATGLPEAPVLEAAGSEAGCEVERLDPRSIVSAAAALALDDEAAARAAPALGAAVGRRA
jgi:type IV pilus assembly protein PilM